MTKAQSPIVIAAAHGRYDPLEQYVRRHLPGRVVVRIRDKADLSLEKVRILGPQYIFFPHWSWLIPSEIHEFAECIIFHMTDLPFGRGGSPLQNLIVRGYKETMLTALKCEEALDAGPVYMKRKLSLAGTAEEILQRAAVEMQKMIVEMANDMPVPSPQVGEAVIFQRRKPIDGDITTTATIDEAYDFIRMLEADGYPRAYLDAGVFRLEFSQAGLGDGCVEARVTIRKKRHE